MSSINVFRWSALVLGLGYGYVHNNTLHELADQKAAERAFHHKEELIKKAKEEFKKKAGAAKDTLIRDPEDPKFDLEAVIDDFAKNN